MVCTRVIGVLGLVGVLGGCGSDDPAPGGGVETEGGGGSGGAEAGGPGPVGEESGDSGQPLCVVDDDCDDASACTVDVCEAGVCGVAGIEVSNACRPQIDVDYPERAATVLGMPGDRAVTVTGLAKSGGGEIVSLVINGENVELESDGSFAHRVVAVPGGNRLVFEATDAAGMTRTRVQSFLWGTQYVAPTVPNEGMAPQGFAIYLGQAALDDGDHGIPADDIASLLEVAIANFDVSAFVDPGAPVASTAGYDVYLTGLTLGTTEASLAATDGGLQLQASLLSIVGDLDFDCTNFGCQLAGGDGDGGLSVEEVNVEAIVSLAVNSEHGLDVVIEDVQTEIDPDGVNIWSNDGWTNFLLSIVEPFILDGIVADLAEELNGQLGGVLAPALEGGLNALALATTIDIPSISDPDNPIAIRLVTDFAATDVHDGVTPPSPSPAQGGLFIERGGAFVEAALTPYENLGVPLRGSCSADSSWSLELPRESELEIGLADDLLNQILYAAWRGGLLEFSGDEILGEGGGFGVEDLELTASGMLAPTATDCNPEATLLTQLGDLRLDASLVFFGDPMTFVAYTTLTLRLELATTETGIGLQVLGVEDIATELTVGEDEHIDAEPVVIAVLESELSDALVNLLGDGALGTIDLPDIDLSDQLGLPPGSAVLEIHAESAAHNPGTTVISGHL